MGFIRNFFKAIWSSRRADSREIEEITPLPEKTEPKVPLAEQTAPRPAPEAIVGNVAPRIQLTRITIYAGIDFGTSFTKVVWRRGGRENAKPFLFDHNLGWVPVYCLPSLMAISGRNLLWGAKAADHLSTCPLSEGISRIKMLVAGRHDLQFEDPTTRNQFKSYLERCNFPTDEETPDKLAVFYLSRIMRQIRTRLEIIYPNNDLNIIYQICLPVDMAGNEQLKKVFNRIFLVAEKMAWEKAAQSGFWKKLNKVFQSIHGEEDIEHDRAFAVPEAVAETAAYVSSLSAHDGVHALIDIGGGTTDVSIFNVRNLGTDGGGIYWYAARNIPLGTVNIERLLVEEMGEGTGGRANLVKIMETLSITGNMDIRESIREQLRVIWRKTHPAWGEAYRHNRQQTLWEGQNVQIYYSGGGSGLPSVKEVFKHSWMNALSDEGNGDGVEWGPYPIEPLPVPDDYAEYNAQAPFRRMSVAYGLSIPRERLNVFVLPKEAPDHTRHQPEAERDFVDHLIPLGRFGF